MDSSSEREGELDVSFSVRKCVSSVIASSMEGLDGSISVEAGERDGAKEGTFGEANEAAGGEESEAVVGEVNEEVTGAGAGGGRWIG